jgi:DNA polymerase III gamma/tau subunit
MDAASRGTIDNVRAIVDSLPFLVAGASKRIYIFDEVHRMSRDAQDVLLKPLEDKLLVGIFCTTEPDKIRAPIRSRCEEHQIRRITREHVFARLTWVLTQEGVTYEDDAVWTVVDHSLGHVRDALNTLEMLAQLGPVTLTSAREHLNLSDVTRYYEILLALGDTSTAVQLIEEICDRVSPDAVSEGLAEAAMNSFRLANNMVADYSRVDRDLAARVWTKYQAGVIRLVEYLMKPGRVTRSSLICDAVLCASGAPDRPAQQQAPVFFVAAPTIPAPVSTAAPTAMSTAKEPTAKESTPALPQHNPAKLVVAAPTVTGLRADGIGNLGSPDVQALTSMDVVAVPREASRGQKTDPVPKPKVLSREGFLTPPEWRLKFWQFHTTLATGV